MIELTRGVGSGQPAYLFRAVLGLNSGETSGFLEQWYLGGDKWDGIRVDDEKKLIYPEIIGKAQGIHLCAQSFRGVVAQDRLYEENSFLVNGSVLTVSKRRESLGGKEPGSSEMVVDNTLPKRIVSILAEKKERVLETAKLLLLPLESIVLSR